MCVTNWQIMMVPFILELSLPFIGSIVNYNQLIVIYKQTIVVYGFVCKRFMFSASAVIIWDLCIDAAMSYAGMRGRRYKQ